MICGMFCIARQLQSCIFLYSYGGFLVCVCVCVCACGGAHRHACGGFLNGLVHAQVHIYNWFDVSVCVDLIYLCACRL